MGLAFVTTLVLCGLHTASAQWRQINPPQVNANFYGIDFLDANTGYAVGWLGATSLITRTTDGGVTWTHQQAANTLLFGIDFPDRNNGYAVGYWGGCQCALLVRTTDGGANWQSSTFPSSFGFYQVSFPDVKTGYVAGYGGTIVKTTDGGETWARLSLPTQDVFREIDFPDAQTGYAVAGHGSEYYNPTQIYKTTDGGTTWAKIQDFTGSMVIADLDFVTPDIGVMVGNDGKEVIRRTTDGGTTWTTTYHGMAGQVFQGLDLSDANIGYAVGQNGHIVKTTDVGVTWSEEATETDSTLIAVKVANGRGYVVGFGGTILRESSAISAVEQAAGSSRTQLTVAPNPARNTATIGLPRNAGESITLILRDVAGSEARRMSLTPDADGNAPIELAGLPAGAYFYIVLSSNGPIGHGSVVVE